MNVVNWSLLKRKVNWKALRDIGHTKKSISDPQDFMDLFILSPYRLFGRKIDRFLGIFGDVEKKLLTGNIKITFPAYVTFMLFFTSLGGVFILVTSFSIALLMGSTLTIATLLSSMFGLCGALIIFTVLYTYPSMQTDTRRRVLEDELPYVASHMAVLATAGLPPERILRSLTHVEDVGIRSVAAEEASGISRDVHFLGYDVMSAIQNRMKNSPSSKFVDFLDGFVSVAKSGGNLTNYFLASAKGFMDSARIAAKQLVETLGGLAEAYVTMMVVFPLLIVVMLSIMNMIGGGIGGFSTIFLMQLVTYLAIPMMASIMLLLLDSIMPTR